MIYNNALVIQEYRSNSELKKDTPYLMILGKLLGGCY